WIWIQDRGRVFEWDGQGRPLWMAGAHADVTELQQARQDAAETRQRLQAVVDASDEVAVIATDTDGTITLFNTGAERLLGYSAVDVVGQRRLDAFHDPGELAAWMQPLVDADGNRPDVFEA
ncbi:PAS domain-containing protein, partial [Mesorhizobium sp. M1C.F.Ca.ET.176.01.1.1]